MVGVSKAESTAEVNCQVLCLFEPAPFPSILGVKSMFQKHLLMQLKVQQKLIVRCIACGSLLSVMGVKSSILGDAAES